MATSIHSARTNVNKPMMPTLRPQYASRLLRSPRCHHSYVSPIQFRCNSNSSNDVQQKDRSVQPSPKSDSSTAPAAPPGDSAMIRQEDSAEGMINHQPNFRAPIDHGTSSFSPVPKHVMDGSEPGEVVSAAVLSGAPVELQARVARIYKPAKTATQSGSWHGHYWRLDWDVLHKGHRWENPLMGWQSSADFLQGTHLNFKNKEDAIRFAQKQGYEYFVQEPNERKVVPKAYANNFMHSPKPLKKIPTK